MNQQQKKLAEKAIKLKYNGLINALGSTATTAEKENTDLKKVRKTRASTDRAWDVEKGEYRTIETPAGLEVDDRAPEKIKALSHELGKAHEEFRVEKDALKKRRSDERALVRKRWEEEDEADARMEEEKEEALRLQLIAINDLVAAENTKRADIRKQAATVRNQVLTQLRTDRDEAVMQVAFDGEGDEMLSFLKSLPGPEEVAEIFIQNNLQLSEALPSTTGIGDGNPRYLLEDTAPRHVSD